MQKMDGMNYAPVFQGNAHVVVEAGTFCFAVIGLDHGHIFAMTNGLIEAGATLVSVFDEDKAKMEDFCIRYPQAKGVDSLEDILQDETIQLVASAIRPDKRCALGLLVMAHDKDYFADKPGLLTFEELEKVRIACKQSGRKYFIYFGERIHVEGAVLAEELIKDGRVGRVVSMTILAPHRLNAPTRPAWFFDPEQSGGIITDIGSHQIEQFLTFAGAKDAKIMHSAKANYNNPEHPDFFDWGECSLVADNKSTCYFRVDWFTPDGLGAWGDGRVFIVGTEGSIEIRKYLDVAQSPSGDNVYLVDREGEHKFVATGKMGFVFFGDFILDCMNRTEKSMTQEHVLLAMGLALEAEKQARVI
ncbi:MAG TPA: Gfo/Idh/MocA family oxidoreductase [Sphaerochaeta sp.]|nr:Gfo/Idh/MocA family oxidoreductase [Sphaerochaeta sp.]